ncbi:MAG: branched-chain amino acid ABC transporter permease [Acidimicrobiales bacterium]
MNIGPAATGTGTARPWNELEPRSVWSGRASYVIGAAVALAAAAIALWGSVILVLRATEVAVFAVAFVGLHLLSGRLGLISVGHGAFVGFGALTAAHAIDDLSLPYLLAPLAGLVGGGVAGAVIAAPSLRLPGAYVALLTLAVAMVLPIAMRQLDGPLGYRLDGDFLPPAWTGLAESEAARWQYLVVVVVGAGLVALTHLIVRGRFTRSMIAVRDDRGAAAAFGIAPARVQLLGVGLSAGLAGAAGGLGLYASPLVAGDQYPFSLSVAMFALMLALGASRAWTALPAAVILVFLPEVLIRLGWPQWIPIVYAVVLLVMTRVSRGRGLLSVLDRFVKALTVEDEPVAGIDPALLDDPNPWLLTAEPDTIDR